MRFLAVLIWLFAASSTWAMSQETDIKADRAEIIRLLGQLPDITPIREELQAVGFKGANLELAVKQAELIYRDPVLAGHVADQVIAAFEAPQTVSAAGGLMWPLVERGLGHLNTNELKFYYQVERAMIKALPVRQCGLAVRDRLRPQQFADMTARVASRLETDALREYYRIQAKAARFGVKRAPVQMSAERIERVEARIQDVMTRSIAESKNPEALLRAMGNLERATNAQACTIGRLFMDVVMTFDGRSLRETLVYMSLP